MALCIGSAAVIWTSWLAFKRHLPSSFSQYLARPWNPRDLQIAAFFVLVAVFDVWERLRPARTKDRWADVKTDLLSFSFAVLVNRISTRGATALWHSLAPTPAFSGLRTIQALPGAIKIGLAIVVVDFVIYWIHRAQHRFDALWRTHVWHHSPEHLYWLSGFRTSFMHSFIYNLPQAGVPMLMFGLTPVQAAVGYSIGLLIQFWEHTNVRVNIGPLRWLFITPDYHRVHHSATQESRMNLGTTFSLWDRMFGTYVDPARMPESFPLGLGEPVDKKKVPRMLLGV